MINYNGYIFDLDDTLYCEHDYVHSGFWVVANEIKKYTSCKTTMEIFDKMLYFWKKNGRGKIFDEVCNELNVSLDVSELVRIYRNHIPRLRLYEDALQIIYYLNKKGKKLGLITDGESGMQWRKIESLGIKELFDCIVVTGDLGKDFWKPSEVPYKKVVNHLNLQYAQCVYIGDNPSKDFIAARKLGMSTIRIVRPKGDHMQTRLSEKYEADMKINNLIELV